MPSLSKLLHRDKASQPKPSSLQKSAVKPPLKSPTSSDLCKTEQNTDRLNQCAGCNNVELLIRRNNELLKSKSSERLPTARLHHSFDELERCALKCEICRVFRQALILAEVTFVGVERLRRAAGEVFVRWEEKTVANDAPQISLKVEVKGQSKIAGVVNCNKHSNVSHLALSTDGLQPAVIEQVKAWLNTCRTTHIGDCDNLRWSRENPKFLIEITSPTTARLRQDVTGDYVALSYCWGMQAMSDAEREIVKQGSTVQGNVQKRCQSFSITDLPATVRDALHIIHAIGIRYAWIDSLCIIQDKLDPIQKKPEGVESMHLVYSNALFTLCVCATTRATEPLLSRREAWTQRTEPCQLGTQWLTTADMSLTELRLKSPLAGRAWTLQEERLSPRMLYVTSNRVHWSCAKSYEMEMKPTYGRQATATLRPSYMVTDHQDEMPPAQDFLLACFSGTSNLQTYWADIVKSYTSRDMSFSSDRLTALSGIAAKYLNADKADEYLAGIWAKHLTEGLAWRVKQAIPSDRLNSEHMGGLPSWPSWSWAVVPPATPIETRITGSRSEDFMRVVDTTDTAEARSRVDDPIRSGELVKEICVSSFTRPLLTASSLCVDWETIPSIVVSGEKKFSFAANPEQDVHAIESQSGRILVREDRKKEVIGQIDFHRDVESLLSSKMELKALQLGTSTMLLLRYVGEGIWCRVGAACDVREDFFASAQVEVLIIQ